MKAFLILPAGELENGCAVSARLIADLLWEAIGTDPALFAVWHVDEIGAGDQAFDLEFGPTRAVRITGAADFKDRAAKSGDPDSGQGWEIRSFVTCRSLSWGPDGQAVLCLSSNDPDLECADPRLLIERRPDILVGTDLADGIWLD